MGMGYQALSQLRSPPVFQEMVAQGKVSAPVFSFKLSSTAVGKSELYLGGTNPAYYDVSTLAYYPVTQQAYWSLDGVVNVNGAAVGAVGKINAIIDTGTVRFHNPSSFTGTLHCYLRTEH
jgi:cathepsin D